MDQIHNTLSIHQSRYSTRKTTTCHTPRITIQDEQKQAITENLSHGLQQLHQQKQQNQEMDNINQKLQKFARNKFLIESLPKLEPTSRSHFKKYIEDMQLEFDMWNHPPELFLPLCIQRTYPDIKSELLRAYKNKKITNKTELTKYMAQLCLKGESYDVVKSNYITSNKMTESALDFSTLYNKITNKQIEHLLSLDDTLTPGDMCRERTRLTLEMYKASIHPEVLAHCQALGKTSNIEDLLQTCNNYAQSTSTKKQYMANFGTSKKVFNTTINIDDKDRKIEMLEKQLQYLKRNSDRQKRKFWCKHCIPNNLKQDDCQHCWRHSDLSKGIIRKDCQQCKYWRNQKARAESAPNASPPNFVKKD